ncbi:hypothetical protein D3C80_1987480 [compost metagenome]
MGSWASVFVLLSSEDIKSGDTGLSVTMLSGLGSGDFSNLARMILDDHKVALLQGASLLWESSSCDG